MSDKYTMVSSPLMVPAAPGWKVSIDGSINGKSASKLFLVAAFATISGEDGRSTMTPIIFNEQCEGLTLAEMEAELEASGFEIKTTMLLCGNERATEDKRR